jgi:hypothetical protein
MSAKTGQFDMLSAPRQKAISYQVEREFSFPISGKPNLYEFSANNRKIGIVCHDENRIYLINSNGELYAGFPLQGNTDFSIGFLTSGNSYFNLLVGNEDNSFFNYKME